MDVETLELPLNAVQASPGFALDIGGSIAKIIYRSKKDYDNGIPKDRDAVKTGKGKVCMVNMPRDKIDDMLTHILENCDLSKTENGEKLIAYSTGFGGQLFQTKIEEGLNVKMENVAEYLCFVSALCLMLKEMPREELFKPDSEEGLKFGKDILKVYETFKQVTVQGSSEDTNNETQEKSLEGEDGGATFPLLLALLGSGLSFVKINSERSYEFYEGSTICGKFFHGLSSCLTGEKDFSKISHLLEDGDGKTVDTFGKELVEGSSSDANMYSVLAGEQRVYPFGKMLTDDSDRAKKGDLVHSLLESMCESIGMMAYMTCLLTGVRRIFFAGNFANIPKVQRFLTTVFYVKNIAGPKNIPYEFLKQGGYMGAIGALLETHRQNMKTIEGKAEDKEQ